MGKNVLCKHCKVNRSSEGRFERVKGYGWVCSPCANAIKRGEGFLRLPEADQQRIMLLAYEYYKIGRDLEDPPSRGCHGMGKD